MDDLPNQYFEKFDVNIISDLILDLLRFKLKPIIDAASLNQAFIESQSKGKTFEVKQFLSKMIGGKNYQSIFDDWIRIVK